MGLRGLSHSIVARVREIILVGAVAGTQQSLNTWHHYLSTQSALGIHGLLIHGFNQPLIDLSQYPDTEDRESSRRPVRTQNAPVP